MSWLSPQGSKATWCFRGPEDAGVGKLPLCLCSHPWPGRRLREGDTASHPAQASRALGHHLVLPTGAAALDRPPRTHQKGPRKFIMWMKRHPSGAEEDQAEASVF